LCPETQAAVHILAAAYERVSKRDPLYGERRRARTLPPRPACAARLMAPGAALEIPRLAAECLDPFRPQGAYSGAFALARNLLLAGIGAPDDWKRSNGDPVSFMLHTVTRTGAAFDRRAIDAVAHTNLVFGTYPSASGWREPEGHNLSRIFVAVEATHISIVYLRETFELLAKAGPCLPATFYRMLLDALSQWILCYDEAAVESYYEYRLSPTKKPRPVGRMRRAWKGHKP
jgi:hypothetical protein